MRYFGALVLLLGACAIDRTGRGPEPSDVWIDARVSVPPVGSLALEDASVDASTPDSARPDADASLPDAPPRCPIEGLAPGEYEIDIDSGGRARRAHMRVPSSLDPATPAMLVLSFHGLTDTAAIQEARSGLSDAAEREGFVAVYPEGLLSRWNAGDCCNALVRAPDDVGFVRDLIDEIEASVCIDPHRVFATGFSNGAMLAYRLACQMSDRIAAIAPVAGALTVDDCDPPRHVPVLHVHGTSDPVVPYDGGRPFIVGVGSVTFRSVGESLAVFRGNSECFGARAAVLDNGDAHCDEWACPADGTVELCTIDGGGHTWPGGSTYGVGAWSGDLDATAHMIAFFNAHPMR